MIAQSLVCLWQGLSRSIQLRTGVLGIVALLLAGSAAAVQTCKPGSLPPATTPVARFTDNGDGTLSDTLTFLQWKRCVEGQTWDSATCTGGGTQFKWDAAMAQATVVNGLGFAGKTDWRVPNIKELASIVEDQCEDPAVNISLFPNVPLDSFGITWSSTPSNRTPSAVFTVSFKDGQTREDPKNQFQFKVRLVRFQD